jgi:hypothetical protein
MKERKMPKAYEMGPGAGGCKGDVLELTSQLQMPDRDSRPQGDKADFSDTQSRLLRAGQHPGELILARSAKYDRSEL